MDIESKLSPPRTGALKSSREILARVKIQGKESRTFNFVY